jgi:hypothetical protein
MADHVLQVVVVHAGLEAQLVLEGDCIGHNQVQAADFA